MSIRQIMSVALIQAAALLAPADAQPDDLPPGSVALRVATFNIEDLRTWELVEAVEGRPSPRLERAIEIIQRIRPNILLVNEIAYDMPGAEDFPEGQSPGQNPRRLADLLRRPAAPGLEPLAMNAWTAAPNTGRPSGLDLDRSGEVVTVVPPQPPRNPDGSPVPQTDAGRAFGGDAWGFGTFPGQYGMALLVDSRLQIDDERVRTFRLFPWSLMPDHLMPVTTTSGGEQTPWYTPSVAEVVRLSSKSHWDIPVILPNGARLHVLASHPTPPAFDGPEERNKRRNHDEIRFWTDYIAGESYIVDDAGRQGPLPAGRPFVIVGDLNADPDEGSSINDPIGGLINTRRLAPDPRPTGDVELRGLDPDDTAFFGLRVDYVLPSRGIDVLDAGVWRRNPVSGPFPSDHFPVWVDIVVPAR